MNVKTIAVPPDWKPKEKGVDVEMGPDDLLHVKVGLSSDEMGDGLPPWIPSQEQLKEINDDLHEVLGEDHKILTTHFGINIHPVEDGYPYEVTGYLEMGDGMAPWEPSKESVDEIREELHALTGNTEYVREIAAVTREELDALLEGWDGIYITVPNQGRVKVTPFTGKPAKHTNVA